MKELEIDIETYSSAPLNICGVYKYVESPDFEILLFGYSVDGGETKVVDLAQGEKIPEYLIEAIKDDKVIKIAHNSQFERICLSRYLNIKYLSPGSWHCTMIWAAYLSLPFSLSSVGEVLGIDRKKMEEGKELVRYFCTPCTPTKANGGRTRNLPHHAPEKWELFKKYNKRDVEAEIDIKNRLEKYPVPDFVWDEYHLDQEINDRGILVDIQLVDEAIRIDGEIKAELMNEMKRLTECENPNSVAQLRKWLSIEGIDVESLGKKDVKAMLDKVPEKIRYPLTLRLQLAKSSVKKYQAMKNSVCEDGRCHGMFQFYGANHTGRWCLTGDHEVLTKTGWISLNEWKGGYIACWNASNEAISFQKANALAFDYSGPLYTYTDSRIDQCSTPDHKMRVRKRYDSDWQDMTVEEMAKHRPLIPIMGYKNSRGCADPAWLRVLIMTQADGHYTEDGEVRFHFKKNRKIERCKMLLRKAQIYFTEKKNTDCSYTINIPARYVPLWLRQFTDKTFGYWLFDENPDIFFDELPYWDGYFPAPNSIQYCTTNKTNADIVQALAHMSGRTAVIREKKVLNPNWANSYAVDIWLNSTNAHEIRTKPEITDFNGKVYCAETQTGYFLVRRNGKVWITGNSGKTVQLQNLPQNHLPDLAEARALVRSGNLEDLKILYDDIPDTLSQLIRTAFISPTTYLVADYSAIECRVIAWLAGEKWVLDAFAAGKDIYCATAEQMFHVPVEKHGQNAELRQKGKQCTLSCGYGGGPNAMIAMGALSSGMKEDELQPLVEAWRSANPNIVKFWWDIDKAAKKAIKEKTTIKYKNLVFSYQSSILFITLPSGRKLSYIRPRIEKNKFGGESITYEGIGEAKKWTRLETYGPKIVENIVQATSRDILANAMKNLKKSKIVAHVHDELIVEKADETLEEIEKKMAELPIWADGLILRADGYETKFYKKD